MTGDVDWLDGGVTAVPGILAGGVAAGIKPSGRKDLALIHSPSPARSAAVFTTNQVKGAPVLVSMEHARGGALQTIVANSGCSNVCNGERGLRDAREIVKQVADLLRVPASHVLIGSTGVIGHPLPMDKIERRDPKAREVAVAAGRWRRRRGHSDDGHADQGSGAALRDRRPHGDTGWYCQGRGDDRAPHGHDVLLRDDRRCRGARRPGRSAQAGGGPLVQPDHRGQRHVDERHRRRHRQRPGRERAGRPRRPAGPRVRRGARGAHGTARPDARAGRRGGDQAGFHHGAAS